MGRKHHQIADALSQTITFPWHGVARCSDGSAVLIFPFLRATWELRQHNEQLARDRKIKWKDIFVSGHFQDRWFRIFNVMNKITNLESTIAGTDRGFEWMTAHQEFPLWLDLFHFYVPMLLDALVVALGLIISDAPASFPKQFKALFKENIDLASLKLRCDEHAFRSTLNENREWHDRIRPSDRKSVRDSIVHRLSKWQITTQGGLEETATQSVKAHLHGEDSDIAPEDGLREAEEIMAGFCSFLSALPPETWINEKFEGRDLITAGDPRHIGGRFLPELPEIVQVDG